MPQLFGVADDQDGLFGVPDETPAGGIISGVVEPIRAMGSGISRAIGGGLSGIAAAAIPGGKTGAEMVESVQSGAFTPQTETGQRNLQYIGDLAEYGIDLARFPISGIGGLIELLSGQGTQQAANTVSSVQEEGVGVTAGERVFEETGSPLAATIAQVAPEGIAELAALKGSGTALKGASRSATNMVEAGRDIFPIQTPARREIAGMLESGSTDRKTAGFRLEPPKKPLLIEGETLVDDLPSTDGLPATVARPKAIPDPLQKEAVRQGFDSGIIAPIREGTPETRRRMLKQLNIMQRGKENLREESRYRASDVSGDSVLERLSLVREKNLEAGKQIEAAAGELKGSQVDATQAIDNFRGSLNSLGIDLNPDGTPNFQKSDIEKLPELEGIFTRLIDRIDGAGPMDAYELHRLKMYIDQNVTWGKGATGLSGKVERTLKELRVNIDATLDNKFPEYDRVNTQYSETVSIMNDLQSAVGTKIDLEERMANAAVGTAMRGTLSNIKSRQSLFNALEDLDTIATKYGGNYTDDVIDQVLFADQLDEVFGTSARTGLAAQTARQVPTSQSGLIGRVAESVVGGVADKVRNVNQDAGFKAMRDLLNSFED